MHGVKRTKVSKADAEANKRREQSKIQGYLQMSQNVLSSKKNKDWSEDAFKQTSLLLNENPEFYTVWNYRRNILLHGLFPKSSPEDINKLLLEDLMMTTVALKAHPKVYWIWNHRRWCLENIPANPEGDVNRWKSECWEKELRVVEKILDVDPRNFHAWNYRRYVLAEIVPPRSKMSELAYTKRKIDTNFSNFSAWHQRSKVLISLWASGKLDEAKSRETEFESITSAMYTDPSDQSIWIYHRWLVGSGEDRELLEREIKSIQELLVEEKDSKWCMESLVHYKRMLLRNHTSSVDVAALSRECQALLQRLQQLDPPRRRRYEWISNNLTSGDN